MKNINRKDNPLLQSIYNCCRDVIYYAQDSDGTLDDKTFNERKQKSIVRLAILIEKL